MAEMQKLKNKIISEKPLISIVVLNWNRLAMLRMTLYSLIATIKFPYELIIIDNGSTDGSQEWILSFSQKYPQTKIIPLKQNQGGEALNKAYELCRGDFIYTSENDLEYHPDWDLNLLLPFYVFPDLGMLSPFSPEPQTELGEVWTTKPSRAETREGVTIQRALENVGCSGMMRRTLIDMGLRWKNLTAKDGEFLFPADGDFSQQISKLGFFVAWSDVYQVTNWGHNPSEWKRDPDYYQANWQTKSVMNIDGLHGNLRSGEQSFLVGKLQQELEVARAREKSYYGLFQELGLHKKDNEAVHLHQVELTSLYVDDGNGFKFVHCQWENIQQKKFEITFDLSSTPNIKSLRWIPMNESACHLSLQEVILEKEDGCQIRVEMGALSHNASLNSTKERLCFLTTQPHISIPAQGKFKSLRICGAWDRISPHEWQKYNRACYNSWSFRVGYYLLHPWKLFAYKLQRGC